MRKLSRQADKGFLELSSAARALCSAGVIPPSGLGCSSSVMRRATRGHAEHPTIALATLSARRSLFLPHAVFPFRCQCSKKSGIAASRCPLAAADLCGTEGLGSPRHAWRTRVSHTANHGISQRSLDACGRTACNGPGKSRAVPVHRIANDASGAGGPCATADGLQATILE